jgi:hypothetical protein
MTFRGNPKFQIPHHLLTLKVKMSDETAAPRPTVVAMILCQAVQDLATGSINLLELYHSVNASSYPIEIDVRLYLRLEDAVRGTKLALDFCNASTLEPIGDVIESVVGETEPRGSWITVLELNLEVPAPGEYAVRLIQGEKIIGKLPLPAYQTEPEEHE